MTGIGIVGLGFMGMTHYRAAQRVKRGKVVALCTRSRKKLEGDWRGIRGNFGDPGGMEDLSGIGAHEAVEDLLADPRVELVDICLPTKMHPEVAVAALEAGKHVLVEKPIALELRDADRMLRAARANGRRLMVAQVLRFFPEFALVKYICRTGRYGALLGMHLKRVIARPDWSASIADSAETGGMALDLHIHDTDFVNHLLGRPSAVRCTGLAGPDGAADYIATQYVYEGRELCVTCCSGAVAMRGRPFEHGYDVYFEKGTLIYNSATCPEVTLFDDKGRSRTLPVKDGDPVAAFAGELQDAVDVVSGKKAESDLSGASARDSLMVCLREIRSLETGKTVRVPAVT